MGGWPLLEGDKWNETGFDWMEIIGKSKILGYNINYFLDWDPEVYFDGENQHIIFELFVSCIYLLFIYDIERCIGKISGYCCS